VADSDALTSEETEEFEGRFWAAVKSNVGNSRSWQKEREQAGILLRRIAVDIGTQAVVFVDASSRQLNAIRLPCGAVLEGALEVWDAIGGEESSDIAMGTADLNDGLLLERNHMSADEAGVVVHGADVYELTTWGSFDAAVQKLLGKQP